LLDTLLSISQAKSEDEKKEAERNKKVLEDTINEQKRLIAEKD
jgi:hypothetical protein